MTSQGAFRKNSRNFCIIAKNNKKIKKYVVKRHFDPVINVTFIFEIYDKNETEELFYILIKLISFVVRLS